MPWQESFALYPEKREQLVGSLLPSDDSFYFYSIVLSLSRLQPGDGLPEETVKLLERLKQKGYLAPRFKQLQARCDLIEMQAKGTSEKRVAELKKKLEREMGVSLSHDPPFVEGKEREKKYKSVMNMKTLQDWEAVARKQSAVVRFLNLFSSSFPFLFHSPLSLGSLPNNTSHVLGTLSSPQISQIRIELSSCLLWHQGGVMTSLSWPSS